MFKILVLHITLLFQLSYIKLIDYITMFSLICIILWARGLEVGVNLERKLSCRVVSKCLSDVGTIKQLTWVQLHWGYQQERVSTYCHGPWCPTKLAKQSQEDNRQRCGSTRHTSCYQASPRSRHSSWSLALRHLQVLKHNCAKFKQHWPHNFAWNIIRTSYLEPHLYIESNEAYTVETVWSDILKRKFELQRKSCTKASTSVAAARHERIQAVRCMQ